MTGGVGVGVGVGVTGISGLHSFPTFLYPVLHVLTSHTPQVFVVVFHTCSPLPLATVQDFLLFIQEFPSLWNPGLQFLRVHGPYALAAAFQVFSLFPLATYPASVGPQTCVVFTHTQALSRTWFGSGHDVGGVGGVGGFGFVGGVAGLEVGGGVTTVPTLASLSAFLLLS